MFRLNSQMYYVVYLCCYSFLLLSESLWTNIVILVSVLSLLLYVGLHVNKHLSCFLSLSYTKGELDISYITSRIIGKCQSLV